MLTTVIIPNAIAMTLLLVLLASANSVSRRSLLPDSKIFLAMVFCNFFQCAGEVVAFCTDGQMLPGFHVINLALNSALFIVNIGFAYLWVVYADYKIFENMQRIKERAKILAVPAAIIIVGSIANLFFPVFFEIASDNTYHRTSLYIIPYLATYFYLTYGTVFIYRHKSQARKYVFLPALVFMLPILLGSIVQFLCYGVSTIWVGVAVALMAVYVNMQNEISYIDSLSGLYTRVFMNQYLETVLKSKDDKSSIAGIMIDIDEFKTINDTFGHLAGDDAIRSAGKILRNSLSCRSVIARYGGDEFVILQEIKTEHDILETLETIASATSEFNESKAKPYTLHFSKGYSILNPSLDTIDSFMERMDTAMYEAKKTRKLLAHEAGQ